jgi:hypothetical protein
MTGVVIYRAHPRASVLRLLDSYDRICVLGDFEDPAESAQRCGVFIPR